MSIARDHPVEPARKASDAAASGDPPNQTEQLRIVQQDVKDPGQRVVREREIAPDLIFLFFEDGAAQVMLNHTQQRRLDEPGHPQIVMLLEMLEVTAIGV